MKSISLLMLVSHISSFQAPQAVTTLLAQRRNEVKLHCLEKHAGRTVWYGQRTNQLPFIIMAAIGTNNPIFIHGENPRFKLEWETITASFSLKIANFNESDEGFYYCSVRDSVYTILGSGYILTLEQEKTNVPTQTSATGSTPVLHEENGHWQWQRQAILPVVFLIVSGMALYGIYNIQKQPRRKKQTAHDDELKGHDGVYTTVYYT